MDRCADGNGGQVLTAPTKTGHRGREGAYSFVACRGHLTIDHPSISRRTKGERFSRKSKRVWRARDGEEAGETCTTATAKRSPHPKNRTRWS